MILDFNAIERETLRIVLRDRKRTVLDLTVPSVELIRELQSLGAELGKATGDAKKEARVYDVCARLISCNEQGKKVSGFALKRRYNFGLFDIITFVGTYSEFIRILTESKN